MKRRILTVLLTLALLAGLPPAFAEESTPVRIPCAAADLLAIRAALAEER